MDEEMIRFSSGNTFSCEFKYENTDAGANDIEPNGSLALANLLTQNEVKSGHIKFVSNGVSDNYDFYRTKKLTDGTLKVYVLATNRSGTSGWLNLLVFGGSHGQIGNRYIIKQIKTQTV